MSGITAVSPRKVTAGTSRLRRWSSDEKAGIVVESLRPAANISEVARRNDLSAAAFAWRREAMGCFRKTPTRQLPIGRQPLWSSSRVGGRSRASSACFPSVTEASLSSGTDLHGEKHRILSVALRRVRGALLSQQRSLPARRERLFAPHCRRSANVLSFKTKS